MGCGIFSVGVTDLYARPSLIRKFAERRLPVLSVVYDHPMVASTNDPTVIKINRFLEIAVEYGQLGNYLVEFFTWMKYIPSSVANWKRLAEERHEEYSGMFVSLFREVKDRIVMTFIRYSLLPRSPIM